MKGSIIIVIIVIIFLVYRQVFIKPSIISQKVLSARTFIRADPKVVYPIISVSPTISPPSPKPLLEPAISNIEAQFVEQVLPLSPGNLDNLFEKYAAIYNIDKNLLIKIADCESEFNPLAINGNYGGLYQFTPSTWAATRREMGLSENEVDRFNSEESIKTAAYKISRGGLSSWPACSK